LPHKAPQAWNKENANKRKGEKKKRPIIALSNAPKTKAKKTNSAFLIRRKGKDTEKQFRKFKRRIEFSTVIVVQ